jgi:hypothetical protein
MSRASATGGTSMVTIRPTMTRLPVRVAVAEATALGSAAEPLADGDGGAVALGAQPAMMVRPTRPTRSLSRAVITA